MGVYKEGRHWRADVYINSKRIKIKKGFSTKKEAKIWHDTTALHYVPSIEPEIDLTFNDLIERFEEFHLPQISIATRRRYIQDIELRIRPLLSRIKIKELNSMMLERVCKSLFDELTVKTANNCVGLLKTICNKGVQWDMIDPGLIKSYQAYPTS